MTPPETTPKLRDPAPLWPWLRFFLIIYIPIILATAALNAWFSLMGGADPDYFPTDQVGTLVTLAFVSVSFAAVGIFLICMFLTGRITFRMMRNLHQLQSSYAQISPGWAVGWYFIPFANLVMPQRAVGEIWRGAFAEVEGAPPKEPEGAIARWWTFWLLGNILDNIGSRLQGTSILGEQTIVPQEQLMIGLGLSGVASLCAALAAVFMISLFAKLVRAQSQMVNISALS